MKTKFLIPLCAIAALIFACQGPNDADTSNQADATTAVDGGAGQSAVVDDESQMDILKVAVSSEDHTTLVAAVQAADLTNALANAGPFTVFAPNNDAFAALPEGTVDNLLKDENIPQLKGILLHHVTTSSFQSDQFKDGQSLGMANGTNLTIQVNSDGVFVGGAKILGSVKASNGMVHVVDKVIIPS